MSGLQNLSLEQAAVLIASRVRVKQAGLFNKAIPDADITETMVHEPGGKHFWGGVEQYAEPRLLPRLIGGDANARFNSTADLVNKHYDQVITPEHVDALRQNMGDPELGHPDFRAALLVKYLAHRHPGIFRMRPEGLSNTPVVDMAKHLVPPAVKQAVESTIKPEYSQTLQQPVTQPDPPRNATSPAGGEPGIMDRVRAALSNIDFGSLANKGMDAAKGFSPSSNPLHAALLGGGLGMGVGALGSLTSSDKEKRKRWLRNALFGGAMGGIGGYGAHAAFNYGNELANAASARAQAELNRPQEPTLPDRVSHAATNPTATVAGGLAGGAAGHVAGKMYDRHKDNKAMSGIIGSKDFKPHLDAANAKMRRAGTPEITQAQVDQFGRAATAMPWQTLFGGKGEPHLVATPEAAPPTPQASASRDVIPHNAAQAAKAQAAQPVPPVASFTAKPVRDHVSYRKPKLTAEQTGPLMEGYGHYTAKNPVTRKRPFGLSGAGGAMLGAGLGAALTAAGTPHLSQAQKQQQAATLPTLQ